MPQPPRLLLLASVVVLGLMVVWVGTRTPTAARSAEQPLAPSADTQVSPPAAPPLTPCPGSWSIQAPYPISITDQAVAAQDDAMYSFGGSADGTNPLDAAYKYTPATDTWTAIAPLPAPRIDAQAVSDGTAIYILGGAGVDNYGTNTLWRYNPTTNTYTTLAPYLIPTTAHAAAYLDGKIYRIAGCNGVPCAPGPATNSVEVYTIATNAWAAAAPYPLHNFFLRAIGYDGYVYGAGGLGAYNETYRYDPATDRWDDAAIADLPTTNTFVAVSGILNGRWLLASGDVNGSLGGAVAWNPATNVWEPLPYLLQGVVFGGGTTIGSAFYVVGGDDPRRPTNTNQRYLEVPCTTPTATPTGTLTTPTPTPTVCGVGRWQQEASIPTLLLDNALVAHDGRLYSFGGATPFQVLTATYRYDPATTVWTLLAPLPAPRDGASAVSNGTNIYILGGDAGGGNTPTNTLWRYDPVADTYTTLAPYTIPTAGQAAVLLNGKIYRIAGGTNNGVYTSSVEVYTIATDSWSLAAVYPEARDMLAAVPLGGYIYSAGGRSSDASAKTYRYDPTSNSWDDATVADLPQARWGAATAVYNGRWLIAAGAGSFGPPYTSALTWDPATNTWTNLPTLNRGRLIVAGAALSDGFYTTGGYDENAALTTDNQRYSEIPCGATPTITSTPPPSTATPSATPPCVVGWQVVSSPNVTPGANYLYEAGAVGPNDIWAVGEVQNNPFSDGLILHNTGGSWSIVPNPATQGARLWDVDGTAPNDVWTVGYNNGLALTMHWEGTAWSIVPSPNISNTANFLFGVAARTATDVWASGNSYNNSGFSETLIHHWDGTAWSIVPSPNVGTNSNYLARVAASAANDAWAVGYYTDNGGLDHTLTLHWDGTAWSVVPSPDLAGSSTRLSNVLALAPNDAWAVGGSQDNRTLTLHWNGIAWSIVPTSNSGGILFGFTGITARASNDIWVVGGPTEHWDGSSWTLVPTPAVNGTLVGVATGAGSDVWAVGVNTGQTLIERYVGSCITPTMTATVNPATATVTGTPPSLTRTATGTPPAATGTAVTATPTVCAVQFTDVSPGSTFYTFIRCLACRGIVGGYPCGGTGEPCPGSYFRPTNNVTRGQVSKIVSESAGFQDVVPSPQQTFQDVAPGSTFALWIERLSMRGIIGGYPCGGPFEPCVAPGNRPYFRPNNNVTRGQLAKITSGAAGYTETPTGQTFEDVPPASTFYLYIERLSSRGIIGGYPCGGAGEPCVAPGNRPYFRPNNPATRGQMSKVAANTFFPNCATPARR